MKPKHIIILLILVTVVATIVYTISGSRDQTSYVNSIQEERKEKDKFMRTAEDSPFAGNTASFTGLKYFPPDPKFRITATVTPISERKPVVLATNDGKQERYLEYGWAEFDYGGFHNKLLLLEILNGPDRGKLFLAFGDRTSAEDTYGAGRYLDVARAQGSNTVTLDFNKAYNPYCAYSERYSCPLPPPENLLTIPVTAGEKAYH